MDQLDKIKEFLSEIKEILEKGAAEDMDAKIRTKMHAEMDRRGWTGKQIADHYRDTDESIPAKQRANMKVAIANQNRPKLKVVKEEGSETCGYNKHGQWTIMKSNYGPKQYKLYNPADNIKRKANRTGEELEHVGRNKAIHQYTTVGADVEGARAKVEAKRQAKINRSAPVKTLANMTDEEKAEIERKYGAKLKKGAEVSQDALTTGNLPILQDAQRQPTDQEMFGHLVRTEEQIKKAEADWNNVFNKWTASATAPIDHLNKSKVSDKKWAEGKSFNSMLTEEELAERNAHIHNEKLDD